MKKKKITLVSIVFLYWFTACMPDDCTPIKMDTTALNRIMGKWQLVGKSIREPKNYNSISTTALGYTNDIETGKFVKFTQNREYVSNMFPDSLFFIIEKYSIIYFFEHYVSDDMLDDCYGLNQPVISEIQVLYNNNDTITFNFPVRKGWFEDGSKYSFYYFIKMENE